MTHKIYKKVVLIILDGFGVSHEGNGNAISLAKTPTFDYLVANYPSMTLQASGPLVGLPWGEMGNSEVGHLNIGAGRIVGQDLPRITASIQNGEFFNNQVFLAAIDHVQKNSSHLHLMGMISPGGVHSLDEHLYALLGLAEQKGLKEVFIHMFTDGRDTEPKVALESIKKLRERIQRIGVGTIATIAGRFYAMDRGGHWGQTDLTYKAMVNGVGETAASAEACVSGNYDRQIFDEMIKPTVIVDENNQPIARISDNDSVIFFNFRQDRAIQLTQSFVQPAVVPTEFRPQPLLNLYFATMTEYLAGLLAPAAFTSADLKNNLAQFLSENNFSQFHVAETEKYAHVTIFFNCGQNREFTGEQRLIVTSPEDNAHNYSDHPQMSADKVTSALVEKITKEEINFYLANFANADMVGHTGNLAAAISAVEFLDQCVKSLLDACLAADAALIVTADHGNIEQMINPKSGGIDKDHTTNPVPFLLAANEFKLQYPKGAGYNNLAAEVPGGVISDIAPTILDLFNLPKPQEMTGISLLEEIA